MFKVIADAASGYVGCSRKLAFKYARACRASSRSFLILKHSANGAWRDIAEIIA